MKRFVPLVALVTLFGLVMPQPIHAASINLYVDGLPFCGSGAFDVPLNAGDSVWMNHDDAYTPYQAWANVGSVVVIDSGGTLGTSATVFSNGLTHQFSHNSESPTVVVYFCRQSAPTPTPITASTTPTSGVTPPSNYGCVDSSSNFSNGWHGSTWPQDLVTTNVDYDGVNYGYGRNLYQDAKGFYIRLKTGEAVTLYYAFGAYDNIYGNGGYTEYHNSEIGNQYHIINAPQTNMVALWSRASFIFEVCYPMAATPTTTVQPSTTTNTPSTTATATATRTPTRTATATATATASATPTITSSPIATPERPPCPVADVINVPVAPGTAVVSLQTGSRFAIAGAAVWFNIGATPREILAGNYEWDQPGGNFTVYSLTLPATIWVCVSATVTGTPTTAPTGAVVCASCLSVGVVLPPPTVGGLLPELAISLPTLRPAPTVTVTIVVSTTAIVQALGTIEAGIQTPAAMLNTTTARYNYESGAAIGATVEANMQPALAWIALANPMHPQWEVTGGPLWALAPFLRPVSPILAALTLVVVWQLALVIFRLLLIIADWIVKLIELIPGE